MPPRTSRNETSDAPQAKRNQGRRTAGPEPFWRTKTLDELTPQEWESLCDGCGRCCLVKLEDEDTGEILKTDIRCKLLDAGTCRCKSYTARHSKVDDCIQLTPASVRSIPWLPATCAYRLVAEGKPLRAWHHLVSGSTETVHSAGISVRGRTGGSEQKIKLRDYFEHIVDWDD